MFLKYFILFLISLFFICDCISLRRVKRVANNDPKKIWPNKTIYYSISPNYTVQEVEKIEQGMREWEDHTCLKFIDCEDYCDDLNHYAYFESIDGCFSSVGMRKDVKKQNVSLDRGRGCVNRRTILHEIGHLIGLIHEHQRPDRDNYIEVLPGNIESAKLDQYEKKEKKFLRFLLPYDYLSIMHYKDVAFSVNGEKAFNIIKNIKKINLIGKLKYLSKLNIYEVNQLYDCYELL